MLLLLAACVTESTFEFPTCQVEVGGLEPATAAVGHEVTVTASPMTQDWDTAIRVGGVAAELTAVTREGCDDCDTCRTSEGCSVCNEDCDTCDVLCKAECVESASFLVPALPPGEAVVELYNGHGHSERLVLEVIEATDTGAGDSDDGAR